LRESGGEKKGRGADLTHFAWSRFVPLQCASSFNSSNYLFHSDVGGTSYKGHYAPLFNAAFSSSIHIIYVYTSNEHYLILPCYFTDRIVFHEVGRPREQASDQHTQGSSARRSLMTKHRIFCCRLRPTSKRPCKQLIINLDLAPAYGRDGRLSSRAKGEEWVGGSRYEQGWQRTRSPAAAARWNPSQPQPWHVLEGRMQCMS
jgi:hypothetical protein